ncbi:MAG: putative metalloprotease CJM1_0395 family protein [Gammaproteobacteria bacterium]|nr:putative metalloprotease CJM1_0395 family protein [Gammaproteobacteria bacterium]MDH5800781.1 putative metalloprotease CJM1_0395 family protein [Gammaproteobacteria bacterium]
MDSSINVNQFNPYAHKATQAKPGAAPIQGQDPKQSQTQAPAADARQDSKTQQPNPLSTEKDKPTGDTVTLSRADEQHLERLKTRDDEVRRHEAAHQAAGGNLTGAAQYTYTMGPDGKRYASGGEVSIDTGSVANDPQATVAKAQRVRRAALAPAAPSGQDRQVAAQAAQMEAEARAQLNQGETNTQSGFNPVGSEGSENAPQQGTIETGKANIIEGNERTNNDPKETESPSLANTALNRQRLNHSYEAITDSRSLGLNLVA